MPTFDEDKLLFPRSYIGKIDRLIHDVEVLKTSRMPSIQRLDQLAPVAGDLDGAVLWIRNQTTGDVRGIWTAIPSEETGNYHMVFLDDDGTITVAVNADNGTLIAGLGNVTLNQYGIDAVMGYIGGWVLGDDFLKDVSGLVGMSSAITGGDDVRFFAGDAVPEDAPFRVYESGLLVASNAIIEGTIEAEDGFIGGWLITPDSLENLTSGRGIVLDSSTPAILVGDTTGTYIIIDGDNERIRSSNFVSGAIGFNIDAGTGDAEFNNITARGLIRTAVFQRDVISSVGGQLLVLDSDVLDEEMTALDAETVTIKGNTTFAVGDIIRLKDESSDEWLEVTDDSLAPTYSVIRDMAATYASNTNPEWKKGQAVVNYGQAGDGGIVLEGGASPRLSLFTHEGEPWNLITEQVVMEEGQMLAGRGSIVLDADGLRITDANDAIIFSDTDTGAYVITSLRVVNGYPSYEIRVLNVYSETNLISNGDFATGDFTSWTETDPSSKLSVTTVDDEFAFTIAPSASFTTTYLTQTLVGYPIGFNGRGMVVTFKVKATHANNQLKVGTSITQQTFTVPSSNEWVNMVAVVTGTVTDVRIGATTGPSSTVYIKDIVVRVLEENPEQYFLMNPIQTYVRGDVYLSDTFSIHPKSIPGTSRFASGTHIAGAFFLDGIEDSTTSGTQNDYWSVDPEGKSIYRFNPSANLVLTGWRLGEPSPPVGSLYGGKVISILNVHATNTITLRHESASSTAENRFSLGSDLVIPAGGMVTLWHDGTTQRWRLRSLNGVVAATFIGSNSFQIDQSGGTSDTHGVLSGSINGSNTTFTVSLGAYVSGSLKVFLNGQLQTQGSSEDWTELSPAAGTFNFVTAPITGDLVTVEYQRFVSTTGNADTVDGLHASSFALTTQIREKLTEARTYYVRTDGSDSNNGLANSSGGAFLTVQKAIDTVAGLDLGVYDITIQLGSGTYSTALGNICKACTGSGTVTIIGDETTPANVIVKLTASLGTAGGCFYSDTIPTKYIIKGIQFKTDSTNNYGILAKNAFIAMQKCDFNAGTQNFQGQLRADLGGTIEITGAYTISASATWHMILASGGKCRTLGTFTVTLTGTPAFTLFMFALIGGIYVTDNTTITYSGSATGTRYSVQSNSVVYTNGAATTYFPGNAAGSTATGGQYV